MMTFSEWLKRAWCLVFGHRRGKRLTTHTDGIRPGFNKFECPRCGATWTRNKAKEGGA